MNCIFCNIAAATKPVDLLYADEHMVAFFDIKPVAPFHLLVIPRLHIATLNDITDDQQNLLGMLLYRGAALAKAHGYTDAGYRTIINCNKGGGQEIYHLHIHVLAGKTLGNMGWPE
jgi:histidine triad (HIT) family protein